MADKKEVKKTKTEEVTCGDVTFQIKNISLQITKIQKHLSLFKKDCKAKVVLYKLVARRKRYLNYLERKDNKRYHEFVKAEGIRVSTDKQKR